MPGCSTPPELLNEDEITSELIPSTEVGGLCLPIDSYNTNSIHDDLQLRAQSPQLLHLSYLNRGL